ncbi:unnamed protein product [Didymodactylos carnosus]|uniref:Uncharacterized protein n=1 Tax=Didymodactylos carnosus TaxID=1234261 RepID=A0A8S2D8N1_9BILA|nr:unnamed protein product [Didymodactylos carnosus]CAF3684663.1 unnamed protein product [Didymodactylos carnosus]
MNVLHYSSSLTSCPKCKRLVCEHTSIADVSFTYPMPITNIFEETKHSNRSILTHEQLLSSNGINFYILPKALSTSWTTFGSDENIDDDQKTLCNELEDNDDDDDDIPFSKELRKDSTIISFAFSSSVIRTQSDRRDYRPNVFVHRSLSTDILRLNKCEPTTLNILRDSSDYERHERPSNILTNISNIILLLLFLITHIIDIVILYVYHIHTNLTMTFIVLACVVFSDVIVWFNIVYDYIRCKVTLCSSFESKVLLVPFVFRLYLLIKLLRILTHNFNNHHSSSHFYSTSTTASTSQTTTLETISSTTTTAKSEKETMVQMKTSSLTDNSIRTFRYLITFYLLHSGLLGIVNLYFWSTHFSFPQSSYSDKYFLLPRWMPIDVVNNDIRLRFIRTIEKNETMAQLQHHQPTIDYYSVNLKVITISPKRIIAKSRRGNIFKLSTR